MIDPDDPLAHLYADLDDDLAEPEIHHREGTLDDLVNEPLHPEEWIDSDVTELAILVETAQAAGTSSDEFLAELGLGEFEGTTFDLNGLGLAVTRRMAERAGLIPRGAR